MATWSDARAVLEYQEFLASGKPEIDKKKDGPCLIVAWEGDMEMVNALVEMGMGDDVVITPGQEAPSSIGGEAEYPIYITLPPTRLKEFLKNELPLSFRDRTEDFVFLSGGMKYGNIEKVLKETGYCRDATTQFLVSGFQTRPRIQDISSTLGMAENGEEKFAGECAACGKWSGAVEGRLERYAIRCKTVFYREWRRLMWERNLFDAVFNLVGAVRRPEPLAIVEVALYHGNEVSDMAWAISSNLRGRKALTLTYGFEERAFGIGETTNADVKCVVNGDMFPYLYEEFLLVPGLNEYLAYAQDECGLLSDITFIRINKSSTTKSIFLEGNLRADGAI